MRSMRAIRLDAFACLLGSASLPTEWNQPHGNAASTAFVDVAPLKTLPTERWRFKSEKLLAGLIVSLGKILVVVRDGKNRKLLALDPATGAVVARHALDGTGDVLGIAASGRLLAVVEPTVTRTYRITGDNFKFERTMSGTFGGEPLMVEESLFVSGGGGKGLYVLDLAAGRCELVEPAHFGRPSALENAGTAGTPTLYQLEETNEFADYRITHKQVTRTVTKIAFGKQEDLGGGTLLAGNGLVPQSLLVAANPDDAKTWYVWNGGPKTSALHSGRHVYPIHFQSPPAACGPRLYGVDEKGLLIELQVDRGLLLPLIATNLLPKGARVAPPSIARDVLYSGNLAVEIGSKRLLWCVDTLETTGPTVPSGDEMVVVATPAGELVGLGNGPPPTAPVPAARPKAVAAPLAAAMPGAKPGLIRSDGLFVVGKVTALDGGRWRVEPESGAAQELDADAVALVDPGDAPKLVGDELPLYRACLAAARSQHVAALVALFPQWKELKFYEECRRLVDEAKQFGLAPERADELSESIVGRKSTTVGNADVQKRHCLEVEAAAREKIEQSVETAAAWCAARGATVAASALMQRKLDFNPGHALDPMKVVAWIPEYFPFGSSKAEQATIWATWAEELLPSGARFVKGDEALTKRLAKTPFAKDAALLRTNHILLVTHETDATIICPCLVRAEAAFRALKKLLGKSPSGAVPDDLLEVRLYATRADYLADTSGGVEPPKWSGGFYSPKERVSRFYAKVDANAEDPLGRSLHLVMAHELTHHFVDRCWDPTGNPLHTPGFWMVEGFAEFVAEQAVEVGRLGDAFDDDTVMSFDLAAAAMRAA